MDGTGAHRVHSSRATRRSQRAQRRSRTRRAVAVCAVLLGLLAMHALGTHGAMGGSMPARPVVAVESLKGVHAIEVVGVIRGDNSATDATSPAQTSIAKHVDATRAASAMRATPAAYGRSAVMSHGIPMGAMDAMAMLCVVVLSLALALLVRAALDRTAGSLVGTTTRARHPRLVWALGGLDRRPPVVWEYSVLRC